MAHITATFLREEFATTHTARSFVTVAMVTVEKMAAIAKVSDAIVVLQFEEYHAHQKFLANC